ncbi:MAG: flavin reductase [Planctomycetota bacterium]|jgi:flavorubredoxin/flavin reductase (DIM6/NTAB) family NADH-FMN oxidoreductase RutF|nr:flavin reductase [Planctomycetota bacterium]
MHQTAPIADGIYWVGASDRRLALFENVFPIPRGVSYNAYLVLDEKTVLLDTVDKSVSAVFYENLRFLLDGRQLDYVIVNHVEPDHAANLGELTLRYPEVKIVGNALTLEMLQRFFDFSHFNYDFAANAVTVKEGDTLAAGKHAFTFVMAKMVHWPEAMVTYETTAKILFSADAFGTFGALNGNLFADEVNFERDWLDDARRYYTNIVGKYGNQVQTLLDKAAKLDLAMICPLHGPLWRKHLGWFIDKYQRWSSYTPEDNAVLIAYASVYGGTENAAQILAAALARKGVRDIKMYDVSNTHPSVIVAEAFRCSHWVFASTTYNAGIFCNMETALLDLAAHNLQNRQVALVENGSWAPTAGKLMRDIFAGMKNITVLDGAVSLKSAARDSDRADLENLADALAASLTPPVRRDAKTSLVQNEVFFNISYGLYVLTAKDGEKDNGCIINTLTQITDNPKRVSIAVNKQNYTHALIMQTGVFNVSILHTDAPFAVFQRYGFHSGRDTNKFAGAAVKRSANGLIYDDIYANAFLSGKVVESRDYGTHTVFVAEITEAGVIASIPAMTYAYYFANVKPQPPVTGVKKTGYVCKICGYIHEGETLPPDFICPLCKHGAADFEKL